MNYLKEEAKLWFIKALILDSRTFFIDKTKANFIANKRLVKFTSVWIVNRCVITGRAKSVLWLFRLSWMEFKNYAPRGLLPGLKKWGF